MASTTARTSPDRRSGSMTSSSITEDTAEKVLKDMKAFLAANYVHPRLMSRVALLTPRVRVSVTRTQTKIIPSCWGDALWISPGESLVIAAKTGNVSMVKAALWRGAAVLDLSVKAAGDIAVRAIDYALRMAIIAGHLEVVRLLLDWGADVETLRGTPLCSAAGHGHLEIVRLLLDRGADVHARDDAALRSAAQSYSPAALEIARLLLNRGATVDTNDDEALSNAAKNYSSSSLELVRLLLNRGAGRRREGLRYPGLDKAICYVVENGCVPIVRLLLAAGARADPRNNYPIKWAAFGGHLETVRLLLDNGADIEGGEGEQAEAPLVMASSQGHLSVVHLLLNRGAAVNVHEGRALHGAASQGHPGVALLLLEKGADVHARKDAALLSAVNAWNSYHGRHEAYIAPASEEKYMEVIHILLEAGANAVRGLHEVVGFGPSSLVELLTSYAARQDSSDDDEEEESSGGEY